MREKSEPENAILDCSLDQKIERFMECFIDRFMARLDRPLARETLDPETLGRDALVSYYEKKPDSTRIAAKTFAALTGLKASTLESWRCSGRGSIPFIKVGSRVFYELGAARKFFAENTKTSTGGGK